MAVLRLKELMKEKGISREHLANSVDVSITTISNISTEKNLPTIQLLLSIAKALDVDVRDMFTPTIGGVITQDELQESIALISKGLEQLKSL